MKKKTRMLVGVVIYNEVNKLPQVLSNIEKLLNQTNYSVLFINDNSTDGSDKLLKEFVKKNKRVSLLSNKKNSGVGKSIKNIIEFGIKNHYEICAIMAGNGKDNPIEIKKLINPIVTKNYDYVQGSRFLHGGSFNNLPRARKMMIKGFTLIVYLFTGFYGTDATNGFRAYKLSLFNDARINIKQSWLDRYEFETYLHYKVITLGYRICEVAVSKNYLHSIKDYSKIRPFIDWWKMIRPLIYLKLRVKY